MTVKRKSVVTNAMNMKLAMKHVLMKVVMADVNRLMKKKMQYRSSTTKQ